MMQAEQFCQHCLTREKVEPCGRCQLVSYCSSRCRIIDHKFHRSFCEAMREPDLAKEELVLLRACTDVLVENKAFITFLSALGCMIGQRQYLLCRILVDQFLLCTITKEMIIDDKRVESSLCQTTDYKDYVFQYQLSDGRLFYDFSRELQRQCCLSYQSYQMNRERLDLVGLPAKVVVIDSKRCFLINDEKATQL